MLINVYLTPWGQYNNYIEDSGGESPGGEITPKKDDWDESIIDVSAETVSTNQNLDPEYILFKFPDETKVFCGHGPETTIGREKKFNYILQF